MRGSTVDRDLRMLSGEACRDQLRGRGRQDWTEGHLAVGVAPWRSQWIPTRSNDAARGALRLSHPRRAGWLLCPAGASHWGRASSLWPQVIPRGGSAESWPPHSLAVGGKEFFDNDTKMAMKNIPTKMVEKIKSYDKKSDYSRITGIDDGEEETVLDLTVKKGMKEG